MRKNGMELTDTMMEEVQGGYFLTHAVKQIFLADALKDVRSGLYKMVCNLFHGAGKTVEDTYENICDGMHNAWKNITDLF